MKQTTSATIYERHFTPGTLAELWQLSEDTIVRWFSEVPGVLRTGTPPGRGRRPRITMRIPESVAAKVYAEKTR